MDFHGLDLNLLVALDALLAEKSVTNAGRRVHLSQSAMSGVLAKLRHAFNDDLLVPARRGMELTPLARTLVDPVRAVLLQVQATIAAKVRFDPASSTRTFSIAASDYAIAVFIGHLVRALQRVAPSVRLSILPLRERMEELDNLDLDVMLLPLPFVPAGRRSHVLFDDTFTCIAWADNPHVAGGLSLDTYRSLGHVAVSFDGRLASFDDRFGAAAGLQRRAEIIAPSYQALPELLIGTHRIATIQTRLAQTFTGHLPLVLMPLPAPLPMLEEAMMWLPYFDGDPGHAWFREMLAATAAAMPLSPGADRTRATETRVAASRKRR